MKGKKQYPTLRLLLCLLPAAALWNCTQDGMPSAVADGEERFPLTVEVTDVGFAPDGNLSTRTVDEDYQTTFTEGDRIGIYVSRYKETCPYENLLFELTREGDKLVWKNPEGESLWYEGKNSRYYAYYPYQPGGVKTLRSNVPAELYFSEFIHNWPIPADQSTHEIYTAADLMVCRGELTAQSPYKLKFTFVHQMTLLEIDLTEVVKTDPGATVTYHNFRPWQPDPGEAIYRYLLQPERLNTTGVITPLRDLSLSVTSSEKVYDCEFTGIRDSGNQGKCKRYKVRK